MQVYFARVSVTHCHTILSLQFHFQFRTIMLPEKICQKVLRLIFYWSGLLINVNNRLDNMTIKTHKFQTNVIINSSRWLSKHTFSVFWYNRIYRIFSSLFVSSSSNKNSMLHCHFYLLWCFCSFPDFVHDFNCNLKIDIQ